MAGLLRRCSLPRLLSTPSGGRKYGGSGDSRGVTPPWRVGCGRSGG